MEYVVKHENKWLRNVFRHYIQYLYYRRRIPPETFGWLMEVVPSRSYKLDVRPYQISLEDVRKTIQFLREKHEKYYALYRLMLESGARLVQIPAGPPHNRHTFYTSQMRFTGRCKNLFAPCNAYCHAELSSVLRCRTGETR